MECTKIRNELHAYLEGSPMSEKRAAIEQHLASCPECSNALEELKQTIAILRGLEEVDPPAWLKAKIMSKIRAESDSKEGFLKRLFSRLSIGIPAGAVATMVVALTAVAIIKSMQPALQEKLVATGKTTPVAPERQIESLKPNPKGQGLKPEGKKVMIANKKGAAAKEGLQQPSPSAAAVTQLPKPPKADSVSQERVMDYAPKKQELVEEILREEKKPPEKNMDIKSEKSGNVEARLPAPLAPQRHARTIPQTGIIKDDLMLRPSPASEDTGAISKPKEKKAYAGRAKMHERMVTEKHAGGAPATVVTFHTTAEGSRKLMEERFDEDGRRHGLHTAFDDEGRLRAEVRYEHGQIVSSREYNAEGALKQGEPAKDWPWLLK